MLCSKNPFELKVKQLGLKLVEIQNVAITLNFGFFGASQRMGYTRKSR